MIQTGGGVTLRAQVTAAPRTVGDPIDVSGGPVTLRAQVTAAPRTVGDPIDVRITGALPRGAVLIDRVPRMRDTLPDGVRVLSVDSLRIDGGVVVGRVRVAFFRPDSQTVPAFAIAYRTAAGADTATSAPLPLLIHPVLPVGNATLRDVRDVDRPWLTPATVAVFAVAVVVLAGSALVWRLGRAARRRALIAAAAVEAATRPLSAYDVALDRLADIERAGWSRGSIDRLYAQVADVVRGYLESAHAIPALERTTPEILRAMPDAIANNGGGAALRSFLGDADRVKFAGVRPSAEAAGAYTGQARAVLAAWRDFHASR